LGSGLQIKEKLVSTEIYFWRRTVITSRRLKVRNEVIRGKWE
jgi:hypothetical protein